MSCTENEVVQDEYNERNGGVENSGGSLGNIGPPGNEEPRPMESLHTLSLRNRNIEKPPNIVKGKERPRSNKSAKTSTVDEEELEELRIHQEIERQKERLELENQLKELERERTLKLAQIRVNRSTSGRSKASNLSNVSVVSSHQRTLDWVTSNNFHREEATSPNRVDVSELPPDDLGFHSRDVQHQEGNTTDHQHLEWRKATPDNSRPIQGDIYNQRQDFPREYQALDMRAGKTRGGVELLSKRINSKSKEEVSPIISHISSNHKKETDQDLDFKTLFSRQLMLQKLTKFDGNPLEWPHFIMEFKRTSSLCAFTDDENLIRLRHALIGKAKECVESLILLPGSLHSVLTRLENKFGRADIIISNLIEKLELVIGQSNENNAYTLEKLSDNLENLVNTVELVGKPEYMFNPILLGQMTNKLNSNLKMQWGEYVSELGNGPIDLKTFSNWLRKKSDALLRVNVKLSDFKSCETSYFRNTFLSTNPRKTFTQKTFSETSVDKCLLCKSKHTLFSCNEFKDKPVEDRVKWALTEGICFLCLKKGHTAPSCKLREYCRKCKKRHNTLLHLPNKINSGTSHVVNTSSNLINTPNKSKILLRILPVKLHGPKGELETFAFLDDGSTLTLVEEAIANKLGIEGPASELVMQWSNDIIRSEDNSKTISLNVSGTESNAKKYYLNNVRTVKNLSLPVQSIDMEQLSERWKHLKKIKAISFESAKPTILIGQDNWPLIVTRNVVHGPWRGPAVSKTLLGWVVHGTTYENKESKERDSQHVLHHKNVVQEDELTILEAPSDCCKELRNLVGKSLGENWEDDVDGNEVQTEEDKRAEEIFQATTKKVGDRWETGLIWKDDIELPNNYNLAKQRLQILERRMDRDREFGEKYVQKMEDYISKGYASKRTLEEAKETRMSKKVWYLPHLGVVNPKKPGKFRICFDAAAKFKGMSLNDALLKGPDLFVDITGLIFRFRQYEVAMTADIKEMFPQIIIKHEDQFAQQFLWRGFEREKEPDVYVMRRMIFGAVCSPFSAQKVKNENALSHQSSHSEVCNAILKDHYMDDYVGSCPSVENAKDLVTGIISVHSKGGFEICGWVSNSKELLNSISENIRSPPGKKTKVLGLIWEPNEDSLMFETKSNLDMRIMESEKLPTKREALKLVLQIFDPLGWAALYLAEGKRIMQDIWRSGIEWEEIIPENLRPSWNIWLNNLRKVIDFKLPRCYGNELATCKEVQLHILCDASEKTYAAVAYIRTNKDNQVKVSLIASRHRVAPLKAISIPRLELMAAVLGCKLRNVILREHSINFHRVVMWSDSKTVILWIRNDESKFKTFVANRISRIKDDSKSQEWKWIPSEHNTADYATRNKDIKEKEIDQWFNGPTFLRKQETDWPEEDFTIKYQELPEIKRRYIGLTTETNSSILLPDIERFSSLSKLLNVTAAVFRFAKIWMKQIPKNSKITAAELEKAEVLWIKRSQTDSFQKEIATIKAGQPLEGSTKFDKVTPFIDEEGILRVQGRLVNAKCMTYEARHPIVLDPEHQYTKLLIDQYHKKFFHQGQETVVNELRQRYWIFCLRKAVRSSWNRCKLCVIRRAQPLQPKMGDLPEARLAAQVTPFYNTGIDYFGPITVTVGRRHEKRYGVLFTCLSVRAIHLEIAHSLTNDSTIMAIRRFIARRGSPKVIYSDNGTNLKKANKELQVALNEIDLSVMSSKLAAEGIEWHFIPPASPHMGGSWERLIRTVKVALNTCLNERYPKDEVLQTVFAEVENVINSRPLTYVSSDQSDPESITPNHFLIGRSGSKAPCTKTPENVCLRKAWRIAQQITDMFWQRWIKEYLPQINHRTKWTKEAKPIEVGEFVIITDSNSPRSYWKKGLIVQTYPGADGQIRVVDVKTDCGVFRRPATKIARITNGNIL